MCKNVYHKYTYIQPFMWHVVGMGLEPWPSSMMCVDPHTHSERERERERETSTVIHTCVYMAAGAWAMMW